VSGSRDTFLPFCLTLPRFSLGFSRHDARFSVSRIVQPLHEGLGRGEATNPSLPIVDPTIPPPGMVSPVWPFFSLSPRLRRCAQVSQVGAGRPAPECKLLGENELRIPFNFRALGST
jgi:hypothetical protein